MKLKLKMKTTGEILKDLIGKEGLSLREFARRIGVSSTAVQLWIRGEPIKGKNQKKICSYFGINPAYLAFGIINDNVEEAHLKIRLIPVISWIRAGKACMAAEDLNFESDEKVYSGVPVSSSAYALRVVGDSMQGEGKDSFPEGTTIIVEPELEPENGDYVIAVFPDGSVTFKKLIIDGQKMYLQPLNSNLPYKTEDVTNQEIKICGVVKQSLGYTRR